MSDHKRNFERWRKKLPANSAYLIDQVLSRIVPLFEANGFAWYRDYAGGDFNQVAASDIPLQKRVGDLWPTVQIQFHKKGDPHFQIYFSALPEQCRRLNVAGQQTFIDRVDATVTGGPATFILRRGKWKGWRDSQFGFDWLTSLYVPLGTYRGIHYLLSPHRFLDGEVNAALQLLPILFMVFDRGIPDEWINHKYGTINKNVFLLTSWRMHEEAQRKRHEGTSH